MYRKMMGFNRKMMGFNGSPLCVIWWQLNGKDKHKTVCYTADDKKWALDRFDTVGDHYNTSFDEPQFDYGAEERCVRHPYLAGVEIAIGDLDLMVLGRKGTKKVLDWRLSTNERISGISQIQ